MMWISPGSKGKHICFCLAMWLLLLHEGKSSKECYCGTHYVASLLICFKRIMLLLSQFSLASYGFRKTLWNSLSVLQSFTEHNGSKLFVLLYYYSLHFSTLLSVCLPPSQTLRTYSFSQCSYFESIIQNWWFGSYRLLFFLFCNAGSSVYKMGWSSRKCSCVHSFVMRNY